ncbi:MAG: beta-lactamase family protein [Planctomycetes bacterium]|nr:beta-lactamase family protein [Planctomycetota bacterium]
MRKFTIFAAAALFIQIAGGESQSAQSQPSLDASLAAIIQKHHIPGIAALAVRGDGTILFEGVAGVRANGNPEAITINDRFHLGSCTKAMTATLCARLVEEKKLTFKSTCGEILKEQVPEMHEDWKSVTLEQLLTNRSGAPGDLQFDGLWNSLWQFKGSASEARLALARGVLRRAPDAKPGSKFIYSNGGFSIAGAMAEVVTKKPWEDLMREKIFGPLGMASAGFGAPGEKGKYNEPCGHRPDGTAVEPGPGADNPVAIGPAGIVHCTIRDWAKFAAEHVREGRDGSKLLSKDSFIKLHKPADEKDNPYAMGWGITERDWAGGRTLTHNGSNTMWFCVTWLAPAKDFAVLIACNIGSDGAGKGCDAAAWEVIQRVGRLQSAPASKPAK